MDMEKKSPLRDVMNSTMEKVREMVDANNIVGAPITTPDGVTLIPISRVSFGFGSGGGDYGKPGTHMSVADVVDPGSLQAVRAYKKKMKAAAKAAKQV